MLDPKNKTGQVAINSELVRHGHPASRKMPNGKIRITSEAAQELVDHYVFVHNKKMPNII